MAQFATKQGVHTQLLTATLGPVELWALNTTAEDVNVRNRLYRRIGPRDARKLLAEQYPNGTITKVLEDRLAEIKEEGGLVDEDIRHSVIENLMEELLKNYHSQRE